VSLLLSLLSAAQAQVFLPPEEAAALIEAGAAVVDARTARRWRRGHIAGSAPVSWWTLREQRWRVREGRVSSDLALLQETFEAAGVRSDRPVVVAGAGRGGWGEEGRIFWTLEYLGHPQVFVLDGGLPSWEAAGLPTTRARSRPAPGDFVPSPVPALRADTARVQAAMEAGDAVIWDTRSPEEFLGATPAGERRGGHIPGARGLYYRALTDEEGRLLPEEALRERLAEAEIPLEAPVIALCTGGVRAGFAYAALRELGHPAASVYDASMWAWSADPALPLDTE
jgi:thiosulfate/3-mercaptopyruvate sulfurtransferase